MAKARNTIRSHLTSFRMIILSFALMILIGAIMLCLPWASRGDEPVSFLNALFTSTSAACVTGLVVFDTATKWTMFGRIVILTLIQIGGLGVVTMAAAIITMTGAQIGLLPRLAIQDAVSAPELGSVLKFMRFLITGTFCIEGIGAICLFPVFAGEFGWWKGLGYAIFHAISGFCNAGFDLMGTREQFSSLTAYSSNVVVNVVIMLLIILGGLGFLTWSDLLNNRFRFKRLRLQTKIILVSTAALILLPALYFYFVEFKGYTLGERFLLSLFQSVTPRTAGFNTADYGQMSESGLLITIMLMMIGGAPGSTAGGMKVTTMAVLFLASATFLRRKDHVNCFRRRIEKDAIQNAIALLTLYIFLLLGGAIIMSSTEGFPIINSLFECASALGTVGLTTGITPGLSTLSRMILIFFMFFGRVGGLTLGYSFAASAQVNPGLLPVEKVSVG